ncbi:MAG: HD domain-containing protein [Planctomycetota bacterium]
MVASSPTVDAVFCHSLREAAATRLIPLIYLTPPDGEAAERLAALQAGASCALARPLDEGEFSAHLRGLLATRRVTSDLEDAENVVFALATAIEQKDSYTEGHGERVSIYAGKLAAKLGLPDEVRIAVETGGLLHDVGKIGCPDAILNKPGPLTRDEFEIIKRHPVQGWDICRHLSSLGDPVLNCIRNHHERLDGSGYPDGHGESAIPVAVRLVTISDVFDALATARAYKPAFPTEHCFKILREESKRGWWDAELVEAFVEMMKENALDQPSNRANLGGALLNSRRQGLS